MGKLLEVSTNTCFQNLRKIHWNGILTNLTVVGILTWVAIPPVSCGWNSSDVKSPMVYAYGDNTAKTKQWESH